MTVQLSPTASRDLRKIDKVARQRIVERLHNLDSGSPNVDVKSLAGHLPWRRLRIGDWRVLYRPVGDDDVLVGRIVNRRDLERAIRSLEG